jgi:hypothetical protein
MLPRSPLVAATPCLPGWNWECHKLWLAVLARLAEGIDAGCCELTSPPDSSPTTAAAHHRCRAPLPLPSTSSVSRWAAGASALLLAAPFALSRYSGNSPACRPHRPSGQHGSAGSLTRWPWPVWPAEVALGPLQSAALARSGPGVKSLHDYSISRKISRNCCKSSNSQNIICLSENCVWPIKVLRKLWSTFLCQMHAWLTNLNPDWIRRTNCTPFGLI